MDKDVLREQGGTRWIPTGARPILDTVVYIVGTQRTAEYVGD